MPVGTCPDRTTEMTQFQRKSNRNVEDSLWRRRPFRSPPPGRVTANRRRAGPPELPFSRLSGGPCGRERSPHVPDEYPARAAGATPAVRLGLALPNAGPAPVPNASLFPSRARARTRDRGPTPSRWLAAGPGRRARASAENDKEGGSRRPPLGCRVIASRALGHRRCSGRVRRLAGRGRRSRRHQ